MPFSRSLRDNFVGPLRIPNRNHLRPVPARSARSTLPGWPRRQCDDTKPLRQSFHDRQHCRPIDPVEPKMDSCFKESFMECGG